VLKPRRIIRKVKKSRPGFITRNIILLKFLKGEIKMKVEIIKLKPYIDIFPRVCLDNKTVKHRNKKKG